MNAEEHIAEAERYVAKAEQCLRRTTVSADKDNWDQAAVFAAMATAHASIAQAVTRELETES
jgi:hypothetical protein